MQIHQPKAKNYPSEEQLDAAIAHILNLEKNIQENGYDVSKSIICLNENNVLSDGQRRACALYTCMVVTIKLKLLGNITYNYFVSEKMIFL